MSMSVLVAGSLEAQRFDAAVLAGVTVSQLDGDNSAGYNKVGLIGGLDGIILLSEKMEVSVGLHFNQQGSRCETNLDAGAPCGVLKINLNYVDIPVLFHYKDWKSGSGDHYRLQFNIGLGYGRLISGKAQDRFGDEVPTDQLRKDQISGQVGFHYNFDERLSLGVRHSRAINLLYDASDNNFFTDSLKGHQWSFFAYYSFL